MRACRRTPNDATDCPACQDSDCEPGRPIIPWLIGIDEAGYGPNLGPLVLCATAFRQDAIEADLWNLYPHLLRRAGRRNDARIEIDDSKAVYQGKFALARLERTVGAFVPACATVGDYFRTVATGDYRTDLVAEPWFTPTSPLPKQASASERMTARGSVLSAAKLGFPIPMVRVLIVPPRRFNAIVAHSDNKAAVVLEALGKLLRQIFVELTDTEDCFITNDKLGGRKHYHDFLTAVFGGVVTTKAEGTAESVYCGNHAGHAWTYAFRPRADAANAAVALASIFAKYTREILMAEFNAFWRARIADLKPTAGYPQDAVRFCADIAAQVTALGIPWEQVRRSR